MSYIPFPPLSPEIFAIDLFGLHLALRWYALAYVIGLVLGWKWIARALRTPHLWPAGPPMSEAQLEGLFTWVVVGVIAGGRLGYVLFYDLARSLAEPSQILKVWEGGMSFHGGFVGVVIAGVMFCRINRISALTTGDLFAMVAPIGIGLGRVANFVNAELWGRPTDLPWGVAFPGEAAQECGALLTVCARHPSQIYEALLEGVILGLVLAFLIWQRGWLRFPGRATGLFVAGYGAARFAVEFLRQPDAQFIGPDNPLGLAWQIGGAGLTQGQALSLPMIAAGMWLLWRAKPT